MGKPNTRPIGQLVLCCEALAFLLLVLLLWLDELYDLPNRLAGRALTPVNWPEALLETVMVVSVGLFAVCFNRRMLRRLRQLEGILPICASCKRIRDAQGNWHPVEGYISGHSEAQFSHGVCPECYQRLYPEFAEEEFAGEA